MPVKKPMIGAAPVPTERLTTGYLCDSNFACARRRFFPAISSVGLRRNAVSNSGMLARARPITNSVRPRLLCASALLGLRCSAAAMKTSGRPIFGCEVAGETVRVPEETRGLFTDFAMRLPKFSAAS